MVDAERSMLLRVMSRRRTWVCLFLLVYSLLLSSSWSLLLSIRSWYNAAVSEGSSSSSYPSSSSSSSPPLPPSSLAIVSWPKLYTSVLYGGVFGLLSIGAALAVAVPVTLVTWITVLVLLTFAGRPRQALVMEGRRVTADITRITGKILLREGNAVAGVCVVAGFFALFVKRRGWGDGEGE